MGNQVRNGRNYKDNIIKLSLNSVSTNTAINNDNNSAYNNKKLKNFKNIGFTEENYFSKILQSEQINAYNKKSALNNININKEYLKNSRNIINSHKNKIIFLSSYSSKINLPNKKDITKNYPSPKYINKEENNKTIYTEINKNKYNYSNIINNHKIIHNNKNNNINRNLNKELLYDLLDKYIDKNINNNNINQKKKIDSKYCAENTNEKKSSINSSKFINFDIINENESIIDGIELTNHSIKNFENNNNNNNYNCKNINKDRFYEFEFEDYIKKLNLEEEVNIDRELFERPLFYNRSKKIKSKANHNKIKNNFKTSKCDYNFLSKKIKNNKCNISNYSCCVKKNSLRNSLNDNNGSKSNKKKYFDKKNYFMNNSNNQNKIKRNNKVQDFSVNSRAESKHIFDFNKKKDKIEPPNSNSKLLISNNIYNINNSKKKEIFHKDYFNFKNIIKKNFNNINNFQITDFLLTTKQRFSKNNSQRNFQKSANISLKRIKSDTSSKIDSPKKGKKLYRQGRNGIFCKYLKSNFNSANLSKINNIYTTGNSFENNMSSNNIIDEDINKKNYKIIRILKNKNNLNNNVYNDKNKDIKIINSGTKKIINIKNKKYNNSIDKIKCKFINKRSVSSNNIFDIKGCKNKIIVKNNNLNKNIKCDLLKSINQCESIKKNKISSLFDKKGNHYKNDNNLYRNNINKKTNLSKNKNSMMKVCSNNKKQCINQNNKNYENKKIIKISNYNNFLHKSYSKSNLFCKTNLIYNYKK